MLECKGELGKGKGEKEKEGNRRKKGNKAFVNK